MFSASYWKQVLSIPMEYFELSSNPLIAHVTSSDFLLGVLTGQLMLILIVVLFVKLFLLKRVSRRVTRSISKLPMKVVGLSEDQLSKSVSQLLLSGPLSLKKKLLKERDSSRSEPVFQSASSSFRRLSDDFYLLKPHLYDGYCEAKKKLMHVAGEGCDWLNRLLAALLSHCQRNSSVKMLLLKEMEVLANRDRPDFMGRISFCDFDFGVSYPTFSNILLQAPPATLDAGPIDDGVMLRVDMDWQNAFALTVETELYLHYPVGFTGSLPIQLSLAVPRLSGLLFVSVGALACEPTLPSYLGLALHPAFEVQMKIGSEIGHHTKLRDLPKVAQWIQGKMQQLLEQSLYLPNHQTLHFPILSSQASETDTRARGQSMPHHEHPN